MIQIITRWIAALLLNLGVNMKCVCGHSHSEHDFDDLTPTGFCANGDWATGCNCMKYEVKGNRPVVKV